MHLLVLVASLLHLHQYDGWRSSRLCRTHDQAGRHIRLTAAHSEAGGKNKIKLDIRGADGDIPQPARQMMRELITVVAAETHLCVAMDPGHRHSEMRSHIDLCLAPFRDIHSVTKDAAIRRHINGVDPHALDDAKWIQ